MARHFPLSPTAQCRDDYTTYLLSLAAAKIIGCSKSVVHQWVVKGWIPIAGRTSTGEYLFLEEDILKVRDARDRGFLNLAEAQKADAESGKLKAAS